jgi:hypothetical protein
MFISILWLTLSRKLLAGVKPIVVRAGSSSTVLSAALAGEVLVSAC